LISPGLSDTHPVVVAYGDRADEASPSVMVYRQLQSELGSLAIDEYRRVAEPPVNWLDPRRRLGRVNMARIGAAESRSSLKLDSGRPATSWSPLTPAAPALLASAPKAQPLVGSEEERAFFDNLRTIQKAMRLAREHEPMLVCEQVPRLITRQQQTSSLGPYELVMYVTENPALATQQYGLRESVRRVFNIYADAACSNKPADRAILPLRLHEELNRLGVSASQAERLRLVGDSISGMTELYVTRLYRRLTSVDTGALRDPALMYELLRVFRSRVSAIRTVPGGSAG